MKFDSIIFDLDGTIWDSAETCTEGWNIALKDILNLERQLETREIRSVMGKTLDEIEDLIFADIEPKEKRTATRRVCTECQMKVLAKKGGNLYPKVEETLKKLSSEYKLFIVSNCENGYLDAFFTAHGLGKYFTDYEYWEHTGLSKAENIRLVMDRNSLKNSIYVGDTPHDALSAKTAGIPFIHASYGFAKVEEGKYASIEKFEDLLQIL